MDIEKFLINQPEFIKTAYGYIAPGVDIALEWLTSPAAWSQFILVVVAFLGARYARFLITPYLINILTPNESSQTYLARIRRATLQFLPLLLPILAYVFTMIAEQATQTIFGSGAVIALSKNVFLFIAVRILVQEIIQDPFLKLLGKYVLMPAAFLNIFGLLSPFLAYIDGLKVALGNITFSVLALVRGVIAGGILFWLGRWSNTHSSDFIRGQEEMPVATRELAAKGAEILIFGVAFLLLMNIMGVSLSALAVLGGAVGVGLGFGLQKIASNFISGIILLLEGQATVGDYVELDGGEAGTIIKMTMRAAILETFDGRWIVVPNEDFIITRVTNYSDSGSATRYEAPFMVSYETDINIVPALIEDAVRKYPGALQTPYPPDCELREFADHGVKFAVEFWVNGLDDGDNKYTSDVLFIIWNTLKENGIEIPYPRQVVELRESQKLNS